MKSPASVFTQLSHNYQQLSPAAKSLYDSLNHAPPSTVIPEPDCSALSSRHDFACPSEHPTLLRILATFYTNHFLLDDLSPYTAGLFPTISRFNHSCVPNAHWAWNPTRNRMTIQTTRDVAADVELMIAYIPVTTRTYKQREAALQPYEFSCGCEACLNRELGSDERRARMAETGERIAKFVDGAPTREELEIARDMVGGFLEDYEVEMLAGREGVAKCQQAAEISLEMGELPSAVDWAERMVERMRVCFGEDHGEYERGKLWLERLRASVGSGGPSVGFLEESEV
ncbi:MAG: hypothetical protein Q9157_009024 [Trypethelium eluteriae]